MNSESKPSVIMLGPSLDSKGGMATVVNGYIAAGIEGMCDFEYIETTRPGNAVFKVLAGVEAFAKFRKGLRGCDIVHLHIGAGVSPARKAVFARAAKKAGKAVVLHEHRGILAELYREGGEDFARKTREIYTMADVAVVLSEEWKAFFSKNVCEPAKVRVLHNSVATPVDSPALGQTEFVLFLGHMTDVKGPDVLIRAIAKVLETRPGCRFVFAGDGDAQPYQSLARELGVLDSCEFVGWVDGERKDALLRDCPVYCQPSRNEGMPMALLEAMGYGRACVATRVGGVPQVVEDGVDGMLVNPGDSAGIARTIASLLGCRDKAEEIGAAAREKVIDEFSPEKNLEKLGEIYANLMTKKDKQ